MENPFQIFNDRLANIEYMLSEILRRLPVATEDNNPLSLEEAADFLKKPKSAIYQLVFRRELPHSKIGRKLYFNKQDLIAWVNAGRVQTKADLIQEADDILTGNFKKK